VEEQRGGRRRGASATDAIIRFARAQGAAVLLATTRVPTTYGMLRTGAHPESRLARDSAHEPTPMLYLPHEQYGQIWRLAQRGRTSRLELNIQNRFTNPDGREFTVVGEIAGTDRARELVMVGAHYDSWHSAQGATDNAAGSIVMLEAMRILKALNLPMRRTVRIALWSGEEQGLIGSRHYVRMHGAEMARTSAYLNLDNGTGRIRGVYGQNNRAAMQILDQIMMPFRSSGVVASSIENTGGTDHLSFDRAGIPGFQFIQDPIEYDERTHHTSADSYERLVMADLRQAAQIIAFTVYTIANRDELMPRKTPRPMGTN
jgi:Iap family predicted aminopeptidase